MVVKFTSPEEFLKELEKDWEEVYRRIVRVTFLFQPSKLSPNIRHMSLVATASVGGDIIRLERYCGDLWDIEAEDKPIQEKAESLRKTLEEGCNRLGLEVRAGVLEEE